MTDVVYTIQPADLHEGLLGIARRLYGDSDRWVELYEANRWIIGNNPTVIQPGQQVIVPALAATLAARAGARIYVVQPTDIPGGLSAIAQRLYGDAERWPELYAVNQGIIGSDPRLIQAGQRLIIPYSRCQVSGIRDQGSGIRDQESGTRNNIQAPDP
jgi:prophage DNA circulation protein